MAKCGYENVLNRVQNSDASLDEKKAVEDYIKVKKMDLQGMLLSPEEQEMLNVVEELGRLREATGGIKQAKVSLTISQVAKMNILKPKYKNKPINIVGGKASTEGNVIVEALFPRSAKRYTLNAKLVDTEKGSIEDIGRYGANGKTNDSKNYEEVLKASKINSVESVLGLMRKLKKMDAVGISDKMYKHLENVVRVILGPMLRAIPEMAVYVDENAEYNDGHINTVKDKGIYLNVNTTAVKYGNEMSAVTVFVHELVHAVSVFAMENAKGQVAHALTRLKKLRKEAMKRLTYKDFMPKIVINREIEEEIAKERLEYVNNDLKEFLAYSVTHEGVIEKLDGFMEKEEKSGGTLFNKIMNWINKLVTRAIAMWNGEKPNMKGSQAAMVVLEAFAIAQTKMQRKVVETPFTKINEWVDGLEEKWYETLSKYGETMNERLINSKPKISDPLWKKARWYAGLFGHLVASPSMSGTLEALMTALKMKPEGIVQTAIRQIKKTTPMDNLAQNLGLMSVQIDEERMALANNLALLGKQLFKRKLSKEESAALQIVLQMSDGALLLSKYGEKALKFITSEKAIDNRLKQLDKWLSNKVSEEEMRFYRFQVKGLAEMMLTGKGTEVQLRNATAIARMMGSGSEKPINEEIVEAIDEMVSLEALKNTDSVAKNVLAELIKEDSEGVVAFGRMHTAHAKNVMSRKKDVDVLNAKKGTVRETYDAFVTSLVGRMKDKKRLEARGYKFVRELEKTKFDYNGERMGLYVSTDRLIQPFNKSAIRYVGDRQVGRSMYENARKSGIDGATKIAWKGVQDAKIYTEVLNKKIMKGQKVNLEGVITPEFNNEGKIVEYRFNVSMEDKLKYLGMEVNGFNALGRMVAHQIDVEESAKQNEIVMQELLADMAEMTPLHRNIQNNEYVKIDLFSNDPMISDIASILPPEFKDTLRKLKEAVEIKSEKGAKELEIKPLSKSLLKELLGSKYNELTELQLGKLSVALTSGELWVKRNLLLGMFGYRELSITNMFGVKQLPEPLKLLLKKLENMWEAFVSLFKVSVVIKLFDVIADNIISNFLYSMMTGGNPRHIINNYTKAWNELNMYIADRNERIQLEARKLSEQTNKYDMRIKEIDNNMNNMAIKPLIDAGLFTLIMEDAEADTASRNRLVKLMEDRTKDVPEIYKTIGNKIYMTDKTETFKFIYSAVNKSDFVARYDQFVQMQVKTQKKFYKEHGRMMTKKELVISNKKITDNIREVFINYAYPDSALLSKMNKMGLIVFSKYAIRIQKAIMMLLYRHPIRAAAVMLGQEALYMTTNIDTADIVDSSAVLNGPFSMFHHFGVMEMVKQVVIPPVFHEL